MEFDEYVAKAMAFENKDFNPARDRAQPQIKELFDYMRLGVTAGKAQDILKKHIFYGKELEQVNLFGLEDLPDDGDARYRAAIQKLYDDPRAIRLLHASLGLITEAAEFQQLLISYLFNDMPIDETLALKELGDSAWYMSEGIKATNETVSPSECLKMNIEKLTKRYEGTSFSENKAINRKREDV